MPFLLRRTGSLLNFFSKEYSLSNDSTFICLLRFHDFQKMEFSIEGISYRVRMDGRACWVLTRSELEVARCVRHTSGAALEFSIHSGGREWRFIPIRPALMRNHQILEGGLEVGSILPKIGWMYGTIEAQFEQEIATEIVSFAVWLVGIHWVGVAGKWTAARAEAGI